MSAVASYLNGNDVTHSSLLNQVREKKATDSKPTKRTKTSQTRYKCYAQKLILRAKHVRQVAVHHLTTTMTTTKTHVEKYSLRFITQFSSKT